MSKRLKPKPAKRAAPRSPRAKPVMKQQTFTIDGRGDRMRVIFAAPSKLRLGEAGP